MESPLMAKLQWLNIGLGCECVCDFSMCTNGSDLILVISMQVTCLNSELNLLVV